VVRVGMVGEGWWESWVRDGVRAGQGMVGERGMVGEGGGRGGGGEVGKGGCVCEEVRGSVK
jgi:hypothetical protein